MTLTDQLFIWHKGELHVPLLRWGDRILDEVSNSKETTFFIDMSDNHPEQRYGTWRGGGTWKHLPLEDMPKEFRAHLLLIGVSP